MFTNVTLNLGGVSNSVNINTRLKSYCATINCNSAMAILSFYVESVTNTVYPSNYNLSIYAGGKSYQWMQDISNFIRNSTPDRGKIIAIVLRESGLQQIASSNNVTETLAGT